jgi:HK97 gp10 family phage protein
MLKSRIPLIIAELDDKVREGVVEVAENIADGATERVPVDSGALRDAIHVETDENRVRVVAGNTEAFYGHIVEHGGVHTPARPFLIPAYEAERPKLEDVVGEHLEDL